MERLRIDKWLWAARFYKTRNLASEAIDKGRVQVNGAAVKPAGELKPGDTVQMRATAISRTVTVLALSDKRGAAPVAALLFAETPESASLRAAAAEQRRVAPEPAANLTQGRPTKRDRRAAEQMKDWGNRWSASADRSA